MQSNARSVLISYHFHVMLLLVNTVVPSELCQQGLKKCKFPRKLTKIYHWLQVEDYRPLMTSQKEFVFLKTLYSESTTAFTWINLINSRSMCKQFHRRSMPHYRSVC